MILFDVLFFIFGAIVGSFLSALTYRLPEGKSVIVGRSYCPDCKGRIAWYDNIPLVSFFLLRGKCRNCRKKISARYPLVEFFSGLAFYLVYRNYFLIDQTLGWFGGFSIFVLLYLLFVSSVLIAIFVVDFEHQIIPDELIFVLLSLQVLVFIFLGEEGIFDYLMSGLGAGLFLLAVHLITMGRGMGLGDVKFAVFGGAFFGYSLSFVWMFLAFVIGALVGVALLLAGGVGWKQKIAFGPFLVVSFFVVAFFGKFLIGYILPL